ncbi:MAG: DUF3368 domain-containing protein [Candidatus Aminicenantes bacterium]|nr:DUF3368 domain-containing protein [Candidatus Aminicenantes bacterium]
MKLSAVCDTSVLIALESVEKIHLLHEIFSHILIPEEVFNELEIEQRGFKLEQWIIVKKITNIDLCSSLYLNLDLGESEAITLALEKKTDFILLDDKEARKAARNLGLKIIGTVGMLLLAKEKGLLSGSVMDEIQKMENRINFRLSSDLKKIIENSGE